MKKQNTTVLSLSYEKSLCPENAVICGADEAGRGPLARACLCRRRHSAGQLCRHSGALRLKRLQKLSEKKRDALAEAIKTHAVAYAVAFCTVEEIEEYNILGAALLAMTRAIENLAVSPVLRSSTATKRRRLPFPVGQRSAATENAVDRRRPRSSPKPPETPTAAIILTKPIRPTALPATRATAPRRTMPPSKRMGYVPSIGRVFSKTIGKSTEKPRPTYNEYEKHALARQ